MLQLEFSEKRKPTVLQTLQRDPLDIFQDALKRQIECVQAALNGQTIKQSKYRYISGTRTSVEVPIPKWYWEEDGLFYLNLKYSTQVVYLDQGKPTICCGDSLDTVLDTLHHILEAHVERDPVVVNAVLEARRKTCWRKRPAGTVSNHRQ